MARAKRIKTLPNALAMIGMQETRKILTSKAMSDLARKVDEAGFVTKDFFAHSVSVGLHGSDSESEPR